MTPHQAMYGEKKDVCDYRAFGCQAYVYEDKQRRANGKHTPRAKEAIYVGTEHECVGILDPGRQENQDNEPSQVQ